MNNNTSKDGVVIKLLFYGVLLFFLVLIVLGIKYLLIPFLISILLYFALHSTVDYFESLRIPRSIGILIVFLGLGFITYWIFNIYIPPAIDKISPFLAYWSKEFQNPEGNKLTERIEDLIPFSIPLLNRTFPPHEIAQLIIQFASITVETLAESLPDLVTILLITPIICFFILLDANRLYKTFISFVPNRYFEMALMITYKINRQLTSYLKGVFIQSGIMIFLSSIGFYLLGLNFFFLFAVFLGLANLIPYLGPIIGFIPPAVYVLVTQEGVVSIVPVIVVVILCQIVDNLLIQPTLIAKTASLHPIMVLVAITVGGNLMGLWGMLFAVPLVSILKVTLGTLYTYLREYKIID